MTSAERQLRIEQFEQAHRKRGLPVTVQRRAVFEAILEREDHPTADQVCEAVRARVPGISRMTVYRILGTLARLGLVAKTCHPGSSARFDPKIRRHHHLVCLDCDGVLDPEDKRLNDVAWPDVRRLGLEIENYHIHFRGRCAACRRRNSPKKKSKTKGRGTS